MYRPTAAEIDADRKFGLTISVDKIVLLKDVPILIRFSCLTASSTHLFWTRMTAECVHEFITGYTANRHF